MLTHSYMNMPQPFIQCAKQGYIHHSGMTLKKSLYQFRVKEGRRRTYTFGISYDLSLVLTDLLYLVHKKHHYWTEEIVATRQYYMVQRNVFLGLAQSLYSWPTQTALSNYSTYSSVLWSRFVSREVTVSNLLTIPMPDLVSNKVCSDVTSQ